MMYGGFLGLTHPVQAMKQSAQIWPKTMTANALAPDVARSSAAMVLMVYDN